MMTLNIFNPMVGLLIGSLDRGFPAELWYTAMLALFIWVLMSCIDCAKKVCSRKSVECKPVEQAPENKEGGMGHE